MLLGKERFIFKSTIAVKLDSCTAKQLVGEMQWLFSCYLFSLMRAILFRVNATTASESSTGMADDSVDHASALASNGSSILLSSCILSYTYELFDFVSNALFWSRMN